MRKRWKWLALITIVVGAVLWLRSGDPPVVTTLRLGQAWPDGMTDELRFIGQRSVWIGVRSDRIIKVVSRDYSVEAHTPAGQTKYDAQFSAGQGAFGHAGARLIPSAAFPVEVAIPLDADEFRVKIDVEEFGDSYSALWVWAFHQTDRSNRFAQMARGWLLQMQHKGVPITVWSPWVIRSNNVWMEKGER